MASSIPEKYSLVNFDEDDYDPKSPKLVIDEDIDVVSDNPTEFKMAIDQSPKPAEMVKSHNLINQIKTLNKSKKRLREKAIHQELSTSANRPQIEIETRPDGEDQQNRNVQNTCSARDLEIHEQPSTSSGKRSRNENETSSISEEKLKDDFLKRFLPPEFEMSDLELARRAQLGQREEELFEKFLAKADIEDPLELAYHDRKARKNVSDCDCNEPDCNECKRWIRNLKSLESRHKANSEYRLNLLRILFLQQRIEQITKIGKMMKILFIGGYDK